MIRIGIIGTGRIASRFVAEVANVPEAKITVVCNPHIASAEGFAKANNIELFTDHMENMKEQIDAVYIATPHGKHYTYAKRMLEIEKHVLCEKPLTICRSQAEELYSLALQKECVLMEAIKTEFCQGFQAIVSMANSGKIGEIVDVEAAFTKITPIHMREYQDVACGGSFSELGTYTMLPVFTLLGTSYKDVKFFSRYFENGVDTYTKTYFDFGERTATCKTGIGAKSEGQLLITGTRGYILAPSPWWLTRKFQVRYEDPNRVEEYEFPFEGAGLRYEISKFCERIEKKELVLMKEAMLHIIMADVIEKYLEQRPSERVTLKNDLDICDNVKIWAHRGCSKQYPENTLESFKAAAKLDGLTGIELDVQFSKDGELVVIHDEKVDRTTDGKGAVLDFTLKELKEMKIAYEDEFLEIPTFREVLELLKPYCEEKGLMINVELKTSVVRYPGIEKAVLDMVKEFGLSRYIVYSSFLADSIDVIKKLDSSVKTGMLAVDLDDCLEGMEFANGDAVHPYIGGLRHRLPEQYKDIPVRAWNGEEDLYGMCTHHKDIDLMEFVRFGATDIFTNEPEKYLK